MARLPTPKNTADADDTHAADDTPDTNGSHSANDTNGRDSQRERIYRAAVACFDTHGIRHARMEGIAQHAGVSRQTVYFYFPDKVSLIAEVVIRQAHDWLSAAAQQLATRPPGIQTIIEALLLIIDKSRNDPYLSLLLQPNTDRLAGALANTPAVHHTQQTFWYPLFQRARTAGELRTDLNDEELLAWVELVGLMIMTHGTQRGLDNPTKIETLLNQFLAPSLHHQTQTT